jgi:hypothetical protein
VREFRLAAEHVERFGPGTAHIIAMVTAEGDPLAGRGWGLTFDDDHCAATALIASAEIAALGYPDADPSGTWIALTAAMVRTLAAAQVKGPITGIRPTVASDLNVLHRYCDAYFDAVLEFDLFSRRLMERLVPDDLVAVRFAVAEAYDQTPGPGAGRPLSAPATTTSP